MGNYLGGSLSSMSYSFPYMYDYYIPEYLTFFRVVNFTQKLISTITFMMWFDADTWFGSTIFNFCPSEIVRGRIETEMHISATNCPSFQV